MRISIKTSAMTSKVISQRRTPAGPQHLPEYYRFRGHLSLEIADTFYNLQNIRMSNGYLSALEGPQALLKEGASPRSNHRVGKVLKTGIFLEKGKLDCVGRAVTLFCQNDFCHPTRISVALILQCLASGMTREDILRSYPTVTRDGIDAALDFAARQFQGEEIRLFGATP